MCCSVGFARSLGLALLPLALCCILANLLLLFPMGEITYIEQDRLASYIWYFGGLGGGGLLMLVPAVVFITLGKCNCCWNEGLMMCGSVLAAVVGLVGSGYCFVMAGFALVQGPQCFTSFGWSYPFAHSSTHCAQTPGTSSNVPCTYLFYFIPLCVCGVFIIFLFEMNGVTRSLCTFEDIRSQESVEGCRRLRLTLHNQSQEARSTEQHRDKPIGRAFALVQPASDRTTLTPEPVKSKEEQVEVIKVYLEARRQEQQKHQQSLKMLSDEVSQIQEVRYCLKTLREQMAAKNKPHTNGWKVSVPFRKSASSAPKGGAKAEGQEADEEAERIKLREVSKRLYAQLQEAEKKHQEEKERLQAEGSRLREHLSDQEEKLKTTEEASERKDKRIEELQRLLGGMELESTTLREAIRNREEELRELRKIREEGQKGEQRAEQLEKEVAILKEKIHHLDDMLKSQQRKVRHMIEQLQNSRMVIQERDRVIKELEEKVAFLEAENREMHDQMDYFLGGQRTNSYLSSERNPQIVYSKPIKLSTSSNKPLPFIKVIEIKS